MKVDLKNKKVLVTGAYGGLGLSICNKFIDLGCTVVASGRDQKKLSQAFPRNKYKGDELFTFACNLQNLNDIENLINWVDKRLWGIDILINNAGIFPVKSLQETSLKDYEDCFEVNVRAPFLLSRAFSSYMQDKKWGRIVNIGSSSAYGGFKNTSAYCSSKHALLGLSRSLHDELKDFGIRSYCVSPGSIQTPMGENVPNQDYSTFINPDDIAEYIAFLISQNSNMISEEVRLNRMVIK